MKRVPYWVQGGIFAAILVVLIFFLKVICPLNIGCFADPFLIPLFSPILLIESLFGTLGSYEPLFIFLFWTVFGILGGLFAGRVWGNRSEEVEDI